MEAETRPPPADTWSLRVFTNPPSNTGTSDNTSTKPNMQERKCFYLHIWPRSMKDTRCIYIAWTQIQQHPRRVTANETEVGTHGWVRIFLIMRCWQENEVRSLHSVSGPCWYRVQTSPWRVEPLPRVSHLDAGTHKRKKHEILHKVHHHVHLPGNDNCLTRNKTTATEFWHASTPSAGLTLNKNEQGSKYRKKNK